MSKNFRINLDLKRPDCTPLNGFKQGDNLSVINGTILQDSTPYNLTGLTLRANFKLPDGTVKFQNVNLVNAVNGEFSIIVLSSILEKTGIVLADISVFKEEKKITSSTFRMTVAESIYNDGAIVGEDGKDLLEQILENEADRIKSEEIRKANEIISITNEDVRKANEIVREDNESNRKTGYSKMDTRIDNLVLGQGSQTEVIDARLDGITNKLHPTLKARLDDTVGRTKKLEEELLSTVEQTVVNKEKIVVLENANVVDKKAIADNKIDADKTKIEVENARDEEANLGANIRKVKSQLAENMQQIETKMDKNTSDISVNQINKNLGKLDQTYMTDEFLQQVAGSTPINAVPAPKSITTERMSNQAITPEKTDFFKLSTNLINHLKRVANKSIGTDTGNLTDNATHDTSDFVEIIPNTVYTSNKIARKGFYNINKNFISTDTIDGTWASPSNAHYVRLTGLKVNWGILVQLNLGDTLLPFEPYYSKLPFNILDNVQIIPELTNFFYVSSNKFNKYTTTDGVVIAPTGAIVANSTYCISDFIEIKSTSYVVKGTLRVSYFDKDKVYIIRNETTNAYDSSNTITPPLTATFMRLSVFLNRKEVAQLNEGNILFPYEEAGYFIKPKYIPKSKTEEILKDFIVDSSLDGTFNSSRLFDDYTSNGWATISSNNVYSMVDSIQTAYPNYITKQSLTPDLTGLEISAYHLTPQRPQMTNQKRYPTIFITTGTHGYERSSVINMYHFVKELCEHWKENEVIEALRFNVNIIWIPIVNPYGWSVGGGAAYQRYNSNGIDIARQFPNDWVLEKPSANTYGGEAPLTEIEALNVKRIFDENPEIDVFYDYHNFGDAVDEYIWLATASKHLEQLGESLIKKMTRKWEREFEFIPEGTWLGYTNIMYQGTMHNYAYKSLGIERSGTFETNNRFHLDTSSVNYNQDSCKAGLESITNFLLINLRDLI